MNAPLVKAQSKIRAACQYVLNLKEEREMSLKISQKKATIWLFEGLRVNTARKITLGLALGALLIVGATMVLGPSQVNMLDASSASNLVGRDVTDSEGAYTNEVRSASIVSDGYISDFEEPYTSDVRPASTLVGGHSSDFEEPYTNEARSASIVSDGYISDFEEPY
ncbi:MAG: hypothetical protein ACE5Q6_14990, partial [Dehalococcoidia bacterium]